MATEDKDYLLRLATSIVWLVGLPIRLLRKLLGYKEKSPEEKRAEETYSNLLWRCNISTSWVNATLADEMWQHAIYEGKYDYSMNDMRKVAETLPKRVKLTMLYALCLEES